MGTFKQKMLKNCPKNSNTKFFTLWWTNNGIDVLPLFGRECQRYEDEEFVFDDFGVAYTFETRREAVEFARKHIDPKELSPHCIHLYVPGNARPYKDMYEKPEGEDNIWMLYWDDCRIRTVDLEVYSDFVNYFPEF